MHSSTDELGMIYEEMGKGKNTIKIYCMKLNLEEEKKVISYFTVF